MTKTLNTICQHYDPDPLKGCGGCSMQHFEGQDYPIKKLENLTKMLTKCDVVANVDAIVMVPSKTRWRARFHAIATEGGVQLGFQQPQSHQIVDMQECHVLLPKLFDLLDPLRPFLFTLMRPRDRMEIQITVLSEQIDILFHVEKSFNMKARQKIAQFAQTHKISRIAEVIKNQEPENITLRGDVYKHIGDIQVKLPVGGFLQASAQGENALLDLVRAPLEKYKPKRIADLFCGLGTFSMPFANHKFVKSIIGYDSFNPSIDAYNHACQTYNLGRLEAHKRDLYDLPLTRRELNQCDAIIIDPPRKGALKQMQNIAQSDMPLVISVSCNPTTFARDAKILIDGGYSVQSITPVDQFIWSSHLEVVGVFTKVKQKKRR